MFNDRQWSPSWAVTSSFIKLKVLESFPHSAHSQRLISCSSSPKRRAHLKCISPGLWEREPGDKRSCRELGMGTETHPGAAGEEEAGLEEQMDTRGWRH